MGSWAPGLANCPLYFALLCTFSCWPNPSLTQQSRAQPHAIMIAVLKALKELNVRWKKNGDYNMKCRWCPGFPQVSDMLDANHSFVDDSTIMDNGDANGRLPAVIKFEIQVSNLTFYVLLNVEQSTKLDKITTTERTFYSMSHSVVSLDKITSLLEQRLANIYIRYIIDNVFKTLHNDDKLTFPLLSRRSSRFVFKTILMSCLTYTIKHRRWLKHWAWPNHRPGPLQKPHSSVSINLRGSTE